MDPDPDDRHEADLRCAPDPLIEFTTRERCLNAFKNIQANAMPNDPQRFVKGYCAEA
jgi:hypothetical protein